MIHAHNAGLDTCDACKVRCHVLSLASVKMCAGCVRVLVSAWAMLCKMYPNISKTMIDEAYNAMKNQ